MDAPVLTCFDTGLGLGFSTKSWVPRKAVRFHNQYYVQHIYHGHFEMVLLNMFRCI